MARPRFCKPLTEHGKVKPGQKRVAFGTQLKTSLCLLDSYKVVLKISDIPFKDKNFNT